MIGNAWGDEVGEMYRQRGRWFLLLGALLGGIIALATGFGFWLEQWGNHIGGGKGENAHDIAVGLAIGLLVVVIVVILMVWRAGSYLSKANELAGADAGFNRPSSSSVSAAVAAWTASALVPSPHAVAGESPVDRPLGPVPITVQGASPTDAADTSYQRVSAMAATELTVGSHAPDVSLAEIIRTIESAEIEIDGLWSAMSAQGNQVHLVLRPSVEIDDYLADAGLSVLTSQDVVLVEFDDRPGAAAAIIRRLTDKGVRVSSAQLITNTRMVITSDIPHSVTDALT